MRSQQNLKLICSFSVLVTLTSRRIDDKNCVSALHESLGDQRLSEDEQQSSGSSGINLSTGIAAILLIATWTLCRKRTHESFQHEKKVFISTTSFISYYKSNSCELLLPFFLLDNTSDDLLSEESGSLKISSKEIYSATGNPSADNFIDQGGAGKVYKGILSNGKHVAVKHIINDDSVETFICEVTSLSDVRHPNLVALLGSCEGVEEYFLVYEPSQNGDLSEWLFGKDKSLPRITRLELAIDSAGGLWLLQTYPRGCIVHRVIKPTNILIDKNFQVKLSDFELSKIMDLGQSYVSSEVRGTFGYADPEYRKNHHVNASGYVYSFGIVLPQLVSGCRARALKKGGDAMQQNLQIPNLTGSTR
ncbi:probable serine/threonine-protein kinase PBL28 [Pyrus communis]|uniref:probable serine/threonine-protein kinase PBL28 n=1 Tax=Pyrus communis TaxID=23211 RepID=UPI0035C1F67A